MPQMKISVRQSGALTTDLDAAIATFQKGIQIARTRGARAATAASKNAATRKRPGAPARPGRNQDSIRDTIRWSKVDGADSAQVGLNETELNNRAKHWIIQNIGTNSRAIVRRAGEANPKGRPKKGAKYVVSVKAQAGRTISSGLVFATGPRGTWTRPGKGSNQQLYLRKDVQGVLYGNRNDRSQANIRISEEIKPKRFVQAGVKEGFAEYESVLRAARNAFQRNTSS